MLPIGGNRLIDVGKEWLRSQVAKAADCKSAIVGSTPTGASASETPAMCRQQRPSQGFFRFQRRLERIARRWILRDRDFPIIWAKYLRQSIVVVFVDGGGDQTGFAAFSPAT